MDPGCLSVCVSVYVCVCLSVTALQPKRLGRFWWNFTQIVSRTWASVFFLRFWISQFDDVMAAILHFSRAALSRSQFWSDFVQIWTQCSLTVSRVCYWKSTKSVGNFSQYSRPRFRKKSKMAAKNKIFEIGQVRCRILLIQTRWSRKWRYFVDLIKSFHEKCEKIQF